MHLYSFECDEGESEMKNTPKFLISLILASAMCGPVLADSIYEKNVKEYIEKANSGIMSPLDLGSNTVMEGMVALRRGVNPEEIGYFLKSVSYGNSQEINIQLMASLGVIGVFAEVGQIEGGYALANRFKKQQCDFAKFASLSAGIVELVC